MSKILTMVRLILLLILSIVGTQTWSYAPKEVSCQYDAAEYFVVKKNIESEAQKPNYDGTPSLRYCCSEALNNDLQENTQNRSFFALIDGFVVTNSGTTLNLLRNASRTKSGLKVDNATLQQIGAAEVRGGKGFSGLTPKIVQNKPATWHGKKTGGTQTVIKYQDTAGNTKFTVHTVTDGAGKVVHRDFDSVLIQSGQQVVK